MANVRAALAAQQKNDWKTARQGGFFVAQNHSLGEWYKKAYGDEQEEKTPFAIMEVRSVSCTKNSKGRSFRWD